MVEACEHGAAPKSQSIALELERRLGLALLERAGCFLRQSFEPLQVELLRGDVNHISWRSRLEPRLIAERLAELGNLAMNLRRRCDGGAPSIELVGELVDGDDPVRI